MNVLIVYAHPNPKSFCHALLEEVASTVVEASCQCRIHDLYEMGFDPRLSSDDFIAMKSGRPLDDVRTEQDAVKAADLIVMIHPTWWMGMPAVLKGWVDRVLVAGFSHRYTDAGAETLLPGKRLAIIATAGNAESAYREKGTGQAIDTLLEKGIFGFMGLPLVLNRRLYAVPTVSHGERTAMLAAVADDMRALLEAAT